MVSGLVRWKYTYVVTLCCCVPSEFWPKVNILFMHFGNLQIITVGNWIWFSTQDFQELSLLCMRWRWRGRRWTFFFASNDFFCLKWLDACKPCWMKAILQSQWDYIITVNRWIGKQQNFEPYFHFIFSSWYEGSSARESVTGYLTNLFEDLDISGDLKKLQRNNYNDDIFPDQ